MREQIKTVRDQCLEDDYYPVLLSDGMIHVRVRGDQLLGSKVDMSSLDLRICFNGGPPSFICYRPVRFYHKWFGISLAEITQKRWNNAKNWCTKRNRKRQAKKRGIQQIQAKIV